MIFKTDELAIGESFPLVAFFIIQIGNPLWEDSEGLIGDGEQKEGIGFIGKGDTKVKIGNSKKMIWIEGEIVKKKI